jgi:DNA invertase Pin-like site-specific DNA recombinase
MSKPDAETLDGGGFDHPCRPRAYEPKPKERAAAEGWIECRARRAQAPGPLATRLWREFYDAAVSGADAIDARAGFAAMLKRIEGNGVRTIIVETASRRFARDLMVQEVGYAKLRERGIDLIAADSPKSFIDDTPTARLVRQVLGAIAEFDSGREVARRASANVKQA